MIFAGANFVRAIENEIKAVLDIQIVEPPPPGRVERFFGSDGALERVFNRCFGWIEKMENDRLRSVVGFLVFVAIAFPLGVMAMWLHGAHLKAQVGMIVAAIFFGYMGILVVIAAGRTLYHAAWATRFIRMWLARNLPRRVVLWDRSWQLRRMGRQQLQGHAPEAAMRSPLEWLLTLVAIALVALAVAGVRL